MESVAYFIDKVWPFVVAVIGAGPVVWFTTDFLAHPIRQFFDLKRETKRLTLLLWDAPEYGRQSPEDWEWQMERLKEPRERLTNVAAEIFAFAQSETFAACVVRLRGYDPAAAGQAAKKLAFELGTDIEDRDKNYRALDTALKFRFDPKAPFYNPYRPGPWKKPKRRSET